MHCSFCDGKGDPTDYYSAAKKNKLISIGFSSHAPVPFETGWAMKKESLREYLAAVNFIKSFPSEMEIYTGLEVDYIPGKISPADYTKQLDYTIGSIHFVESFDDGSPFEIDGRHDTFLRGLDTIFSSDIRALLHRYYELTAEMVRHGHPTIIGHLDKIKIQNQNQSLFAETDEWYRSMITRVVNEIKINGSIVEINTRGIYQKKTADVYPSPWIIELLFKNKIPVTINSDAHHPTDIINGFPETAALLYKIGYRHLLVLHDGLWQSLPFDQNGIQH